MIHKNRLNSDIKCCRGVTLVELLVVLIVVGLLSSVAYPSLQRHILKAHRVQAMSDLMAIQMQLEMKYNGSYDLSLIADHSCTLCESDIERYHISYSTGTGVNRYRLIATPQADSKQNSDQCGVLSINAAGDRQASQEGESVNGCW